MRKVMLLLGLLVLVCGRTASAQNIWPVSFGYWFNCPDPHMPDFLGADQSIDRAKMLDRLCVDEIRGVMGLRRQAMSQQELTRYNSPNMLPAIYPGSASADHSAGASTGAGGTELDSRRGDGTTTPAAPPSSRSPFPSGSKPTLKADGDTPEASLPSSSPAPAPARSPSPAPASGVTSSEVKPSVSLLRPGVPHP